jgi:AAA+ superfamily predicted ATPase
MSNLRRIELDESILISGDKKLTVIDSDVKEILNDILTQMKIINTHLSIMTDESITNAN